MARIRSIHPGIWTDEAFVSASRDARLLFIGILNECDDQGAFEWKPLQIKMRLAAGDDVSVTVIARWLEELAAANLVCRYDVKGVCLGAVRNFRQWQRPKKPNRLYPMPAEVRGYCGPKAATDGGDVGTLSEPDDVEEAVITEDAATGGEPVPNQSPTGGEKSPQRKEEGGSKEEVQASKQPRALEEENGRRTCHGWYLDNVEQRVMAAARIDNARWMGDFSPIRDWLTQKIVPDDIVAGITKCAGRPGYQPPRSLTYFTPAVREEHGRHQRNGSRR